MAKQKIDNDELTTYYQNIYGAIESQTVDDPYGNYVLHRIKGGQKTVFNKSQTEIRNFDMSFLDTIESVYPAILKIMRDPKKSIRYEEEIVSVEKAKKVNSQTVRHLSSHTQLIKEITKEGDVIPSKVLTTYAEEELAIYENRFLKSLVKRMEMFLERRYEVMKVSLESFETQRLNVKNEFLMSGQKVTVDLDIQIKNDLTTNVEATKEQYKRLLYVRELVQGLKGTEFMRALAKARDVLPPIMKTNIILHNPDFKLCYGLWLYLDKVDGISADVEVKEKSYRYSSIFERDINQCMALALTSFMKNRDIEGIYSSRNLPTLKAPKIQNNEEIELELNFNADNKKLEDYTMNQVLLDETAKFFEASMSGMQRTGNTYNESIRVVYRQMLDMLDQIYPRAFGVADEQLESKDLYEQLEFARRRMMILKIVRQQKQMNIARMGKEEKRIEKLLTTLDNKIKVQEEKERIRLEKQREKEEQQRQDALAKAKALEEKRKRLEKEALAKQKAAEKKALSKKGTTANTGDFKKEQQKARAMELAMKRREHLKNQKQKATEVVDAKDESIALEQPVNESSVQEEMVAIDPVVSSQNEENLEVNNNEVVDDNSQDNKVETNIVEPQNVGINESNDAITDDINDEAEGIKDLEIQDSEVELPIEENNMDDQTSDSVDSNEMDNNALEYEVEESQSLNDDAEFEAALAEIQEVSAPAEEPQSTNDDADFEAALAAIQEVSAPVEEPQSTNDDADFEAALAAIQEVSAAEEPQSLNDDAEFEAALAAIQEVSAPAEEPQTSNDDAEFEAALAGIREVERNDDSQEEVIYVDENGNPIEDYDPSIYAAQDEAADEYERMLKESGMTDEEIAALLGED